MKLAIAFVLALTMSARADVTIAAARKVALQKVPGTIVHETTGKKHHVFKFKIRPKDGKVEKKVDVDIGTGKVVEVKDVKPKSKSDD